MLLPTMDNYSDDAAGNGESQQYMPSLTWKAANGRMNTWIDEIDAVKQAAWKRLNTEAGVYDIYSPQYGLKTVDLMGKEKNIAIGILEMRIEETLLRDDRISAVENFSSSVDEKRKVTIEFDVACIFGEFRMKTEVQV